MALIALGYHLNVGWGKAVTKMGLPKDMVEPAAAFMQTAVWPICIGFACVPVYLWQQSLPVP